MPTGKGVLNEKGFSDFTDEERSDLRYEHCSGCGWIGLIKDTVHNYGDPAYDEEHMCILTCPHCGAGTY